MDYISGGNLSNLDYFLNFELKLPSDRVFYGLSNYHKIIAIGQTEQKLWPVKDSALSAMPVTVCVY